VLVTRKVSAMHFLWVFLLDGLYVMHWQNCHWAIPQSLSSNIRQNPSGPLTFSRASEVKKKTKRNKLQKVILQIFAQKFPGNVFSPNSVCGCEESSHGHSEL